jgi:hypothetical protein
VTQDLAHPLHGLIADYKPISQQIGVSSSALALDELSGYDNLHPAVPIGNKNGGKLKQ